MTSDNQEKKSLNSIKSGIKLYADGVITSDTEIALRIIEPMKNLDKLTPELVNAIDKAQDRSGRMIIHRMASSKVHLKHLKILIEKGASINIQDKKGFSPVHCAAVLPFGVEVLKVLNPFVPKLDLLNNNGLTPMNLAIIHNQMKNLKFLLRRGASPSQKNKNGSTLKTFIEELKSTGDYSEAKRILDDHLNSQTKIRHP